MQDDHELGCEMHVHVSSDTGAGRTQCGCGFSESSHSKTCGEWRELGLVNT